MAGLVGFLVALATAPLLAGTAQASCAPPEIDASSKTAVASGQLTIVGRGFFGGCPDTIVNDQAPPATKPITGIRIEFVQNGRRALLSSVDASAQYTFRKVVIVPAWARPGQASVTAEGAAVPLPATVPLSITTATGSGSTNVEPSELARTGRGSVLPVGLVAFALLCWGAFLMRVGQRPTTLGRHRR